MIYHSSKNVAEMFESIEEANDQFVAASSYLTINLSLVRFLRWYNSYDPSNVFPLIEYSPSELSKPSTIASNLTQLENLAKYSIKDQAKSLSTILSKINSKEMMLLENCLENDLRVYYPGIDWEIFASLGVAVKQKENSDEEN